MKNPLGYQTTEYDCGPTTLTNALSYLFKREEIPPDVLKHIILYCLDAYNGKGELGKNGTSGMAMMFICNWLNQFGRGKNFPISCEYIKGPEVFIGPGSRLVDGVRQGGAVVARLRYEGWHYVLITEADEERVGLFDPYYRKKPFVQPDIQLVGDQPTKLNRRVPARYLNSEGRGAYAFGPPEIREATLIYNARTREKPGMPAAAGG